MDHFHYPPPPSLNSSLQFSERDLFRPWWVFAAACRPSPGATSRAHSQVRCTGLSPGGGCSCGTWALGVASLVAAHRLSCSKACGLLQDQGLTLGVPCIARKILNPWATGKTPPCNFKVIFILFLWLPMLCCAKSFSHV